MSTGLLLAIILSISGNGIVQPVCSKNDFQQAFGNSMQGDTEFIARAVFDDYTEQLYVMAQDNSYEEETDIPPIGLLMTRLNRERESGELFDTLLSSLGVLNENIQWKINIANLRSTVLLRARMAKNPWQGVVWPDLPSMTKIPTEVLFQIDSFLKNNIDKDREDRYHAIAMQTWGKIEECRVFEKQAMTRWGEFLQLIGPFVHTDILYTLYPHLDKGEKVHRVKKWVDSFVQDESILASVRKQFSLWNTLHKKLNQTVINLVVHARATFGFDPWSRGCGQPIESSAYKIKNELLQKSAEIQEFNETTANLIMNLLPEELRQKFEEE